MPTARSVASSRRRATPLEIQAHRRLAERIKSDRTYFEELFNVPRTRNALREAHVKVGLAVEPASRIEATIEPTAEPLRLRRIGRPVSFRAEGPGHGIGLPLEWTRREPTANSARSLNVTLALTVACLFAAVVWSLAVLGKRPVRMGWIAIVAVAVAPFYAPVEWPASLAWLCFVALGRVLKR